VTIQGVGGGTRHAKDSPVRDNCPELGDAGQTRDQLGATFGVSGKSVERAEKVIKHGTPELIAAVDASRPWTPSGDAQLLPLQPSHRHVYSGLCGRRES
jgi:hypothetical protein